MDTNIIFNISSVSERILPSRLFGIIKKTYISNIQQLLSILRETADAAVLLQYGFAGGFVYDYLFLLIQIV